MSKILLPLNNSAWGVIVHDIAADEYEHVLSFENETVKKQFIGKELFNDINFDYTTVIDEQEEYSFVRTNSTEAEVEISLEKVNTNNNGLSYTMNDLLNIDCMFVKEEGMIQLYSVVSATRANKGQNNDSVVYNLSLDIMFNVIDELELSGQAFIERAHTIRHNGVSHLKTYNINPEPALNEFQPEVIRDTTSITIDNPELDVIRDISWVIVALKTSDDGVTFGRAQYRFDDGTGVQIGDTSYRTAYKLFIFPMNLDVPVNYNHQVRWNNATTTWGGEAYNNFKEDSNVISIDYVKGCWPFDRNAFERIEFESNTYTYYIDNIYTTGEVDKLKWNSDLNAFEILDWSALSRNVNFKPGAPNLFIKPELTTYEEPRNINNETKLYTSDFERVTLQSKNMVEPFELEREFLGSEDTFETDIKIKQKIGYTPANGAVLYTVERYNPQALDSLNMGLVDRFKQLPWEKNAYDNWVKENGYSSSTNHTIASGLKGVATGAIGGALAGSIVPGLGTVAAAGSAAVVAGVGGFANAGFAKRTMRLDLKMRPNNPVDIDNNFSMDQMTLQKPEVRIYALQENVKQHVFDYLTTFGYNIGILDNVENWLNTRYYYNYIQTGNIFSLIKNRYSADIKNIINDTFKKGFTIWHVRDVNTFKGIANYDYENQEMSLIAKEKDQ